MKHSASRRSFLKKSAAATLSAPLIISLEEFALRAQETQPATSSAALAAKGTMPVGTIGNLKMSRLICGGNLISGYAHSRDLIYVSPLLQHYFTDEKIMETWALCEANGVDSMILFPGDKRAAPLYKKYRDRGGRIQYLAQISPTKDDLRSSVKQAKEMGASAAFLLGNLSDAWTRDGDVKLIGELLKIIKDHGMVSGVAGHELRTIKTVEEAGCAPDFYMKTLHDTKYWSTRRSDQLKEVIDNYSIDNYWCMDPTQTINYMSEIKRPWIAYKVLAAGAIQPRAGFRYAFENGADFVTVGMFDFQIAEDAALAAEIVKATQGREREWYA
jgi:hypothetical protein